MTIIKSITEATGLQELQIAEVRKAMPTSPLKLVIEYDIEKQIHERANNIPKTQSDFDYERGIREGLSIAKGLLNKTKN